MALASYNDILNRVGGGYAQWQPMWGEMPAASVAFSGNASSWQRIGFTADMVSGLPSGVTDYLIASAYFSTNRQDGYLLAKLVNLGSLDISGASGTFTDGSAMPSEIELGNSTATISGPVIAEVTTALNSNAGTFTITYKNQAGTGSQVSVSQTLPNSAPIRSAGWVTLASGDSGVQDITAAARAAGSSPTGVVKFWGAIPLGILMSPGSNQLSYRNFLTSGFNPYSLGAGDTVGMFSMGGTHTRAVSGGLFIVGGS